MEKNIYIKREVSTSSSVQNITSSIANKVKAPITVLAKYYSTVLEREISIKQTLLLLNAQIAFVFAVFPVNIGFFARAICCTWFVKAVLTCKKNL